MNQRVVLFLLNRYSNGQAAYGKGTSNKLKSILSLTIHNQLFNQLLTRILAKGNLIGSVLKGSTDIYQKERDYDCRLKIT
jgi:hypothetical protein